MFLEVGILLYECIEAIPLFCRADRAHGVEENVALVAWNVDEVVSGLAVSVHITGVDEGIPVAAGPGETVALSDFREQSKLRLVSR